MTASEKKCPVDHKLLAEQQKVQAIAREENGAGITAAKPGTHPPETAGEHSQQTLWLCILIELQSTVSYPETHAQKVWVVFAAVSTHKSCLLVPERFFLRRQVSCRS